MATIQLRVNDGLKTEADSLFTSLGLDTSTAIRMFLSAAIENDGIPFDIRHKRPNAELREAMEDVLLNRNLYGPFDTVDEMMKSLLED
ncbi:MAG: type II toxin-antitoxin system RelB/DinJ family antitoxin [Clostridiales Family XIII bacterium]|nr:type II toxin-antitoxin system RelB/DinJ family antitoxin [Clostridiales Family XIII bacterium]